MPVSRGQAKRQSLGWYSASGLVFGAVGDAETLSLISRMNDGGVTFADGIEQDFLHFNWGFEATIAVSQRSLNLVHCEG